ncbi:thymidine kinase family protein [Histomonas meleagridis]|uniref:thymidine kinase family protein n=1 Tax=Histomonas meleagridis TaxID=135588 RepID=UPI00355ABB85|nr:thymidine kinase family protein [Histomonas meleagridis]KAH0806853.1 thymidine kinase family protein [Histomonas meleagridis]
MSFQGSIELILGPMFAGKSTEMLRRIERAELAKLRCIVLKYSKDKRYSVDKVSTHDLQMHKAVPCCLLMDTYSTCLKYEVIGIDEGQFFPDIVEFSQELANQGKRVIIAALDGTFQRKPFGQILRLISKCESIKKLSAVCTITGKKAPFSQRLVKSDDIELIGGAEMYRAASRSSYFSIKTSGKIHLIIGPIQSGKTTELLSILTRHNIAGRSPLLIRHPEGHPINRQIKYDSICTTELPSFESLEKYQIIGIDEAQRFSGLAQWADDMANKGKLIIVSALDSDANQEPYNEIMELFPMCEKVDKVDSVCPFTGRPAPFTVLFNGIKMLPISRMGLLEQGLGLLVTP